MNLKRFLAVFVGLFLSASLIGKAQGEKPKRLFVVIVNDQRGYIDNSGNIVIEPQFAGAEDFSEGLAVVATGRNRLDEGYIDETGKFVIKPRFDKARKFSEGLAAVGFRERWRIIDGEKTLVGSLHPSYTWGYINRTGEYVVEPKYSEADGFSEGLAAVRQPNDKYIFIDRKGKRAIRREYDYARSFSEGLACVMINGKYGFIDKSGKVVIKPQFSSLGDFREGLAAIRVGGRIAQPLDDTSTEPVGGRYVYIDKTGKTVIRFGDEVDSAANFSEGLACVGVKGKHDYSYMGYIDKTGKFVIEPRFAIADDFSDGLARIGFNTNFGFPFDAAGFVDRTGKIVLTFKYQSDYVWVGNFSGGLASVQSGGFDQATSRYGYIDKSGKVLWAPSR